MLRLHLWYSVLQVDYAGSRKGEQPEHRSLLADRSICLR